MRENYSIIGSPGRAVLKAPSTDSPLQGQRSRLTPFPFPALSIHQRQHWLPNLLTLGPYPLRSAGTAFLRQVCLRPVQQAPSPEDQHKPPTCTSTDHRVPQSFSSSRNSIGSHLTSRPELDVLTLWPRSKHYTQQTRKASADDLRDRAAKTQQQRHATHTKDTC